MKKLTKYCLAIVLAVLGANKSEAQVYGVWNGAKEATFWNYDLKASSGTYAASDIERFSVSTSGSTGFLPIPPSGSVKLFTPAGTGGGFDLNNGVLKITSSNSGSPVKFSAYGIEGATAVTSLFFDINFNDSEARNGVLILGIGKHSQGQVFNNTNQILSTAASKGIFSGLRLEFYGGSDIQTYYRTSSFANGNVTDHKAIFTRSDKQHVEIYCNNSVTAQSYKRGNKKYKVPAKTFHAYVEGKALMVDGSTDIPATGELAPDQVINAFVVNASSSKDNALNFSISNIKVGGLQ